MEKIMGVFFASVTSPDTGRWDTLPIVLSRGIRDFVMFLKFLRCLKTRLHYFLSNFTPLVCMVRVAC